MKNIILCEGKTDVILLSYYLEKVAGWVFNITLTKKIELPLRNLENEEVNVYKKLDDELVIWAVGGQSNFDYAVSKVISLNKNFEKHQIYSKIIILRDRDQIHDEISSLKEIQDVFSNNGIDININSNNEWSSTSYKNEFEEDIDMHFLPIIIPFDKAGALETFVLDAISEMGQEEKDVVEKSIKFISELNLSRYLNTQRLKIKGEFAVALGTMFPEKTFTPIDAMLKNINWEKYSTIQQGFKKLQEI